MKQATTLKPFQPNEKEFPVAPALPLTVHADLRGYFARLGVLRPIIAIILLTILTFNNPQFGYFTIGGVVLILLAMFIIVRARAITLTSREVIYRGAFGRKKVATYSDINQAHVLVNYLDAGFGPVPRILVEKSDGTLLMSLNLLFWSPTDVDSMLSVFRSKKVTTTYYDELVPSPVLAKEFPKLIPYAERHPYRVATLLVLGIVVAVTIFVLIAMPR